MSEPNAPHATSYDLITYQSLPRPESHPLHIASVARLLGLTPPAPQTARILELGCASGGNLLPIAEMLPQSSCLGIDLSRRQVELGQKVLTESGITNAELRLGDIADEATWKGLSHKKYDYIICHGVFSWVPPEVQTKILKLGKEALSEDGILYLSYNVLPGWATRGVVRDAMRFSSRVKSSPEEKIAAGLSFLDSILECAAPDDPLHQLLTKALPELKKAPTDYLFHEYLEEQNSALYFSDFVSRLTPHGLTCVGDAQFAMMRTSDISHDTQRELPDAEKDHLAFEQTLDFLRNRRFRESLLCHVGAKPLYDVKPEKIEGMFIASQLTSAEEQSDPTSRREISFQKPQGGEVRVAEPLHKAALKILAQRWPESLEASQLYSEASRQAVPDREPTEKRKIELFAFLLALLDANLIEAHAYDSFCTRTIPPSPRVSRLARIQARLGEHVTSLRHQDVRCEPIVRQVMLRLDGTRGKVELCSEFADMVVRGEMVIEQDGKRVSDRNQARTLMADVLERVMTRLISQGFILRD